VQLLERRLGEVVVRRLVDDLVVGELRERSAGQREIARTLEVRSSSAMSISTALLSTSGEGVPAGEALRKRSGRTATASSNDV